MLSVVGLEMQSISHCWGSASVLMEAASDQHVKIHSTNIVLDQRRPNLEQLKTIGTCIVNTYLSWFGVNLMFLKEYFFRMHKSSQLPARHQLWLLKLVSKRLHGLHGAS